MATTGYHAYTGSVNGQAGSMITFLDALLQIGVSGTYWQKVFTGTNKAVYRSNVGERYYLRVDDSAGQLCAVRGYATMSDVDTGTGMFPTTVQDTNWNWRKSITDDATARAVVAIATDRFFFVMVNMGPSGTGKVLGWFGDGIPLTKGPPTTLRASPSSSYVGSDYAQGVSEPVGAYMFYQQGSAGPANNDGTVAFADVCERTGAPVLGRYFGPYTANSAMSVADGYGVQLMPVFCSSLIAAAGSNVGVRLMLPFLRACSIGMFSAGSADGDTLTDQDGVGWTLHAVNGTTAASTYFPMLAIMSGDHEPWTV
jgi:hypothetical protein